MHEREKLEEAYLFLREIGDSQEDRKLFEFKVSAFLSAARSVLQYAREEAKLKGQLPWYDGAIQSDVVKFFKVERDLNIHQRPAKPNLTAKISIGDVLPLSEGLGHQLLHEGEVTSEGLTNEAPDSLSIEPQTSQALEFYFADWPGPENVVDVSVKYMAALEIVVADGQANGYLTK